MWLLSTEPEQLYNPSSKNKEVQMKKTKGTLVGAALVLAGTLSGCFRFSGGDETIIQQSSPSTERELQDLKAAYDRGIISEQEFNQQRDRIMGR
jgi:Short C-terminal domain